MSNVQLPQHERAVVYTDPDTNRILGFGPENAKPAFPAGSRYRAEVLYSANAIERKMMQYRDQCRRDAEESTVKKLEREGWMRKAIRDAVEERNKHVNPWNRDLNNAMLKVMDHFHQRALQARIDAEVCITAEKYDADTTSYDVAKDSRFIKSGELKHA